MKKPLSITWLDILQSQLFDKPENKGGDNNKGSENH